MLEFFFNIQNTQGKESVHVVLEAEKSHSLVSAGWRAREAGSIVWRPGIQEFYGLTTRPSVKTDKTCMLETRDNRYAIFNSLAGSKLNLPFLFASFRRSMEWVTLTRQSWEGFSDLFGFTNSIATLLKPPENIFLTRYLGIPEPCQACI